MVYFFARLYYTRNMAGSGSQSYSNLQIMEIVSKKISHPNFTHRTYNLVTPKTETITSFAIKIYDITNLNSWNIRPLSPAV